MMRQPFICWLTDDADTFRQWQAFINTARKIYEKIETGVFDVSNEVRVILPEQLRSVLIIF